MLYNATKFVLYHLCRSAFIKEINGLENIPKNGCIIASNHVSYLDPPIIGSIVAESMKTKVHYLAKIELFRPLFSRVVAHKLLEAIPVDRTSKSTSWIKEAKKYLRMGEVIGFFPEGSRSPDNKLKKGKTGAVRLALVAKAPIIPVGIKGTYDLWHINKKFPKIKKIVRINIGKPIFFDKYYQRNITKKLLRQLTDKVIKEIAKLSGQVIDNEKTTKIRPNSASYNTAYN